MILTGKQIVKACGAGSYDAFLYQFGSRTHLFEACRSFKAQGWFPIEVDIQQFRLKIARKAKP